MPVLDGLGAMRRIRQKEMDREGPPTRLPIIAVTANVRKEQVDTAIAAGAVGLQEQFEVMKANEDAGSRHAKALQGC